VAIRNVTIVGTGNVGEALAKNLIGHGIAVKLAARDLEKTRATAKELGATAVAKPEAGDAIFLAVPANAAEAVIADAQLPDGTLVVDCANPMTWKEGPVHAAPVEGSLTAHLASRFPRLRWLKAFNTFGAEFHESPQLGSTAADLYFAGDDAEAKQQLGELARAMGFTPVDVGPLRNAAHLESLAILWIHLATVGGHGRNVAFKLLSR
jgi:predicted dinucleotide-binding enzyme